MVRLIWTLLALVMLNACSSVPDSRPTNYEGANSLLAQAEQRATDGDRRQAIAILERAVRLQPRNAEAWLRLSELYLQQGEYHKAEQFAGRAQQLAPGNVEIQQRSDTVIRNAQ